MFNTTFAMEFLVDKSVEFGENFFLAIFIVALTLVELKKSVCVCVVVVFFLL